MLHLIKSKINCQLLLLLLLGGFFIHYSPWVINISGWCCCCNQIVHITLFCFVFFFANFYFSSGDAIFFFVSTNLLCVFIFSLLKLHYLSYLIVLNFHLKSEDILISDLKWNVLVRRGIVLLWYVCYDSRLVI